MPKGKPIAFRPSDKCLSVLKHFMETHPDIQTIPQAVVAIINEYAKPKVEAKEAQPLPKEASLLKIGRGLITVKDSQLINHEVDRLFRGQESPIIEAICGITEESLQRAFTIGGKKGLMIVIPTRNP